MNLINGIYYDQTQLDIIPGEVWLPITESVIPNIKPYYYISNKGRVWSTYHNRLLLLTFDEITGYLYTTLVRYNQRPKSCLVHRLEMMVFSMIPGYEELYVNHKDGNKTNNDITNLEWSTPSENEQHAYRTGLKSNLKGEDNPLSKHTESQIRKICEGLEKRLPLKEIAISAGMEPTKSNTDYICNVKSGRLWPHVSCEYNIIKDRQDQTFLDSEIHKICKLIKTGLYTDKQIVYMVKPECSSESDYIRYKRSVCSIRNKHSYARISDQYF